MRFLLFYYLAFNLIFPIFSQETNSCDSICCVQSDSTYFIESDSRRITIFYNAKYSSINSYIKDNVQISKSSSHKKRNREIVDLFITKYKTQAKTIANSYGVKAKSGIFVINPNGSLEAVSFVLPKENTRILSKNKAREMFRQLYESLKFSLWEDDMVSECITVRFE